MGRSGWRAWTAGITCVATFMVMSLVLTSPPSGAAVGNPNYYVAVGGSGSVGLQPTPLQPRGAPTDNGYANDLLRTETARWNDLKLIQIGCPGETTADVLYGTGDCHYPLGSQLATAISVLRHHASAVLVTVDLGFNDIVPCLVRHEVDEPCVDRALVLVRTQLLATLTLLEAAAGPGIHIVGVGHYDPYLSAYLKGPDGQAFAHASLDVISRLNDAMDDAYTAVGIPMADVANAFQMNDTDPTSLPDVGTVPRNVAQVCTLTWKCAPPPLGPNPHPNDQGYRVIGEAISDAIAGH